MNRQAFSPCWIGVDIGTSSAKSVVADGNGQVLAWADEEYPITAPHPDWAEQDPEQWAAAAARTMRAAVEQAGVDPAQVAGIGIAGQMHGLVVVGADGRPLRPAIIWADRRSKAQVERLGEQIGVERLGEWTGNPVATGFMLPSWLWLAENEPETARAARCLLLPKDYVRLRMTGKLGAEPSDASSTLLFDPHRREWCRPLLEEIGLAADRLPPLGESGGTAGGLTPEFARACGLAAGTPVVFGGSDVAAQALSQGITEPGTVSCTIGTGGQLFAPTSSPVHDPRLRLHLFCHVLPERWHLEGAILAAGLSLRWLRDRFWPGAGYGELADAAQQAQAAEQGIFFLPYLAGERTPVMDPGARAAFVGLSLEHGRGEVIRAVMEGVVFALRQGLDIMRELGVPVEQIVATGASIRHPLWVQLQADIFQVPVVPAETPQATGLGAAMLAGLGAGMVIGRPAGLAGVVRPDAGRAEMYARAFERYGQIYPALGHITGPTGI